MMFARYNPKEPGEYFWFLSDRGCKLSVILKYFVLVGLELGARLYDLAFLAAIMGNASEIISREDKDALKDKPNQLWEVFSAQMNKSPFELSFKLLETAHTVMQPFLDKGYDAFLGKKMSSKLIAEIAVRAFTQNLVVRKENSYNSLYCNNIQVSDRKAPVFVTNGFINFRQVEPELIIDLPITPE